MPKEPLKGQEEHEITEREVRAYQKSKEQKPVKRAELTRPELKVFLRLVAEMAISTEYDIKLGLKRGDVDRLNRELDIESPRDARVILQRIELEDARNRDEAIEENRRVARDAEVAAQARLDDYEREQAERQLERAQEPGLDPVTISTEDAERQRRWEEQQESGVDTKWRLPGVDTKDRSDILRRFHHEIMFQGVQFCLAKYRCTRADLVSEARRLKLKINWDTVPR